MTVANATQWRGFFIVQIDDALNPPGNVPTALNAVNNQPLLNLAQQIQVPLGNEQNGSIVQALERTRGFTLFAPSSQALDMGESNTVAQVQGNQSAGLALLQNHVRFISPFSDSGVLITSLQFINGSTVYSPTLMQLAISSSESSTDNSSSSSPAFYSAAGEPFHFSYNASGTYVSNGNGTSARITRPDILVENGVIHLIDHILVNTRSEPAVASSACVLCAHVKRRTLIFWSSYQSASQQATQSATDSAAIGVAPIAAPTGQNGGSEGGNPQPSMSMSASASSESGVGGQSSTESQNQSQPSSVAQSSEPAATGSATIQARGDEGGGGSATPPSFRVRRALKL